MARALLPVDDPEVRSEHLEVINAPVQRIGAHSSKKTLGTSHCLDGITGGILLPTGWPLLF
jgi:hypothetical protein